MRHAVPPVRPAGAGVDRRGPVPGSGLRRLPRALAVRRLPRLLLAALAMLATLALGSTPPASAGIVPVCGMTIDISHPHTGIPVSGAGLRPLQTYTIYLRPQVLGHRSSDRHGRLDTVIELPANTFGLQTIQIEGGGCAIEVSFDAGAPAVANNPPPPPSGPASTPTAIAVSSGRGLTTGIYYGLVGLVIGAGLLLVVLATRVGRRPTG